MFVIPVVGVLCKPAVIVLFVQVQFLRSREILIGGIFTAVVAAIADAFDSWISSSRPIKSNVYLALTEGEQERFIESIRSRDLEKYYRFLTHTEFEGALVTGGRIDHVVISRAATKDFLFHQNILRAHMTGITVLDYQTLLSHITGHININDTDIWTFLAGAQRQGTVDSIYRVIKFYCEPVLAGVALVLLLPIMLVVALAIKISSPGPIFFKQRRTGMLGVEFDLIKFRTMRTDAETLGPVWASKNDNRVTKIGKFLRKSRIDELPQLWNVVKGEISLMGPRPERPEFYDIIEKQVPYFKLRLLVRPGITGWAQLLGGYAASIEESERKLEYDLYYMRYLSPRLDLMILGKTILLMIKGNSGR
jgi:lipopolysaccharide/colanic/teichoic acid biosynthesis glycosyltransferase